MVYYSLHHIHLSEEYSNEISRVMAHLQQRTGPWYEARRGKITCSNLGALLGQVSYVSRQQAYERAMGLPKKKTDSAPEAPNPACAWGTNNEPNGIVSYMTKTGNYVQATGLHSHPHCDWLAGSPDGLVGEEGMIEVKCPYYKKRNGESRVHKKVPGHYWMQINALLEITQREWCDYTCWTPEGTAVYRVKRDPETFDYLLSYYSGIYAAIQALSPNPPPLSKVDKLAITDRIERAMDETVDLQYWSALIQSAPPASEDSDASVYADEVHAAKRVCVPTGLGSEGESGDTTETSSGEAVRCADRDDTCGGTTEAFPAVRGAQVQVQAAAS